MKYSTKSRTNKRIGLILLALLLVILSAAYIYATSSNNSVEQPGIDETDLQEAEKHKEELANQPSEENNTTSNSSSQVTPQITSWGQSGEYFELAARVPSIFEDGGTCELTLKSGSKEVKATSTATRNVSDVSCGFIKVPLSKLTPGKWTAIVEYSSEVASGLSDTKEVTVK
ncbi:MAG: hypothetical protein U5K77_01955 [Candidatus Saccharibacteria bacterium]|nr:hypothetical protein [Candidatus Saccharibacteria bacterium]